MLAQIEKDLAILEEQQRSLHILYSDTFEQLQLPMPPQKEPTPSNISGGSQRFAGILMSIERIGMMTDYNIVCGRVLRDVIGHEEPPMQESSMVASGASAKVGYGPGVRDAL